MPIAVSEDMTKSAKEVFVAGKDKFRGKEELGKEEKRAERATKKRKIKTHLKQKQVKAKDERRKQGLSQTDRFDMRELKRQQEKRKAKEKKETD